MHLLFRTSGSLQEVVLPQNEFDDIDFNIRKNPINMFLALEKEKKVFDDTALQNVSMTPTLW